MLHPRVDFINFSFAIVTSVGERPTGEGVEKPLLCALVPGYLLAQALREQAALRTKEGDRGRHGSDSLNQGGLGRCCLY